MKIKLPLLIGILYLSSTSISIAQENNFQHRTQSDMDIHIGAGSSIQ